MGIVGVIWVVLIILKFIGVISTGWLILIFWPGGLWLAVIVALISLAALSEKLEGD